MIVPLGCFFVTIIFLINTTGVIRYFFQWGDPASSPGYDLVPTIFFIYWDMLTLITVAIVFIKMRKVNFFFGLGYLYLIFSVAIISVNSESFYVHGTIRSLVLNGFLFIALSANANFVSIRHINKCIEWLGVVTIGFLLLQIARVYIYNIYPSHSHPGYLVRYGSIYDDSLVLSIILPMFTGYFLRKFQSFTAIVTVCLVSMGGALLTGSVTGVLVMIMYITWCVYRNPRLLSVLFLILLVFAAWQFEYLYSVYLFKQGSVGAHLEGWDDLIKITLPALLGVYPMDMYPEPGYLSLLLNFGAPMLFGVLSLLVYLLYICVFELKKRSISRDWRVFLGATEGLIISVGLANLNFPVVIYSPIYFMLAVLTGIMFYQYSKQWSKI